jgi:hypothetical protein
VFIQGSGGLNGFDITLLTDHAILRPAGIDLTGTVLVGTPTIVVECLSGVLITGSTCTSTDTIDTIELAATSAPGSGITSTPTTGLLFTAIYNITGTTSGTSLGFQTGCTNTSVSGGVCVTVANGSILPVPESVQIATFSNSVPQPDFSISATPTTQTISKGASATFTITITGTNGFNGTVTLSTTISPLVKNGPKISVPTTVGPYSNSTLTVSTTHPTPVGTYTITVTATSGSITHKITITVIVTK